MKDHESQSRALLKRVRELEDGVQKDEPAQMSNLGWEEHVYQLVKAHKQGIAGGWSNKTVRMIADVYDLRGFQMLCGRYNPLNGGCESMDTQAEPNEKTTPLWCFFLGWTKLEMKDVGLNVAFSDDEPN